MMDASVLWLSIACFGAALAGIVPEEERAKDWAKTYNMRAEKEYAAANEASWQYSTDITDEHKQILVNMSLRMSLFDKEAAQNASKFRWQQFEDEMLKREFKFITDIGTAILPEDEIVQMETVSTELTTKYSTGKVCNKAGDKKSKCYNLDPDLTRLFATSRDWDELEWAWKGWRDATGKLMPDNYTKYAKLQNKAAEMNGYDDAGEYWRSWYDTDTFQDLVATLWADVKPLYQHLHAYVRRKLQEVYKDKTFPESGHIPAHLLGNMWAQEWNNIESIVLPFPGKPSIDVTKALVDQGYNATGLFILSEDFFVSLGLEPMPDTFWRDSMIVRPPDREVVCHASAWDFYNHKDFRIKQCTDITMEWLITTHHEMGHIQYYLQYKHLPVAFRDGANPGFHEAIGDVMALSVSTPEHLHEIGLLDQIEFDHEVDLNFLMSMALSKIAFLPFGYLVDHWRWSVFSGEIDQTHYNEKWWNLRCNLQGVSPPVPRSATDFDPGAKYHIPDNTAYIRYFVSFILQFQIHKSLCNEAGNTGPLHHCDIYGSKEAGKKFGDMLKLGSSYPWPEALEQVTGQRTMDAQPLMEYFKPLYDWLQEQNKGHRVGWDEECPDITTSDAYLNCYNWLLLTTALLLLFH